MTLGFFTFVYISFSMLCQINSFAFTLNIFIVKYLSFLGVEGIIVVCFRCFIIFATGLLWLA